MQAQRPPLGERFRQCMREPSEWSTRMAHSRRVNTACRECTSSTWHTCCPSRAAGSMFVCATCGLSSRMHARANLVPVPGSKRDQTCDSTGLLGASSLGTLRAEGP